MSNLNSVRIRKVPLIRLHWFTKLNMKIHKDDPIFIKAQETHKSRIKFYLNFSSKLARQSRFILLENGKVAGSLSIEKRKHSYFVYAVGVKEEYRRKGYGTFLMKFTEDYVKKKKRNFICLSVLLENEAAVKMYEKLGYHSQGVGLTLVRLLLWKMDSISKEYETNAKITFRKLMKLREIEKLAYHWWAKEIEAFAGKNVMLISVEDSILDLDFNPEWPTYEIKTDEKPIGFMIIIPSGFFQTIVLFSDPLSTWGENWFFRFIDVIMKQKLIHISKSGEETKSIKLDKSSVLQLFLTHQHKDNLLANLKSGVAIPDSTEDRQIFYKKLN